MVFNNTDWVWQVQEDILEPEREIPRRVRSRGRPWPQQPALERLPT